MIIKKGDKWCLMTKDGGRELGCHDTKEGAEEQERAVQISKHEGKAASSPIRTAYFEGREHLVVPVVALVEGVIHAANSESPELVPLSEIAMAPAGWNGRPVVVNHPEESAIKISANDPATLERQAIGTVFNAHIEGDRLKMEAWIDPAKAEHIGGPALEILARLRAGELVDVSVGVFVTAEESPGTFRGKEYKAIWRGIVPDHLALLPRGIEGACSIDMGCGAPRAARRVSVATIKALCKKCGEALERKGLSEVAATPELAAELREAVKGMDPAECERRIGDKALCNWLLGADLRGREVRARMAEDKKRTGVLEWLSERLKGRFRAADEPSDMDLRNMLDKALRAVEAGFIGVEAIFAGEGKVVYATAPEDSLLLWRRGYSVDGGELSLEKDREEVKLVTKFEPLEAAKENVGMKELEKKVEEAETRAAAAEKKSADAEAKMVASEARAAAAEKKSADAEAKKPTEDEFFAAFPAVKEIVTTARKVEAEKKTALVNELKALGVWKEEELAAKPFAELEKLAKATATGDYTGRRAGVEGDGEIPQPRTLASIYKDATKKA